MRMRVERSRVVLHLLVLAALAAGCAGIKSIAPSSGYPGSAVVVETEKDHFKPGDRRSGVLIGGKEARVAQVLGPTRATLVVPGAAPGAARVELKNAPGSHRKGFEVRDPLAHASVEDALASPAGAPLTPAQRGALEKLAAASVTPARVYLNPLLRNPAWIGLRVPTTGATASARAGAFLSEHGAIFQLAPGATLSLLPAVRTTDCCTVVRAAVLLAGVPVFSAGLELTVDAGGFVTEVSGLVPSALDGPAAGTVTEAQARAALAGSAELAAAPGRRCVAVRPLLPQLTTPVAMAWHFALPGDREGLLRHWLVDAATAKLIATTTSEVADLAPGAPLNDCTSDLSRPVFHVGASSRAPTFVSWVHVGGHRAPAGPPATPQDAVMELLQRRPDLFGDGDPRRHQRIASVSDEDAFGSRIVRTEQSYAGLPVFGAGLAFRVGPDRAIWTVAGNHVSQLKVDVHPTLDATRARDAAVAAKARATCPGCKEAGLERRRQEIAADAVGAPTLGVLPAALAHPPVRVEPMINADPPRGRLAYRVVFRTWAAFVDAHDGTVLYQFAPFATHGAIRVFDANGAVRTDYTDTMGVKVPEVPDPASSTDADVRNAHDFAHGALDYWYGRVDLFPYVGLDEVMDNGGDGVNLIVDANPIRVRCPNAYHGTAMGLFAGPDHMVFCPTMVQDDIVTHEMMHGVTGHSAGLVLADEPGALAESFGNIMGQLAYPDGPGTWVINGSDMASAIPSDMSSYAYPLPLCYADYAGCDHGYVHFNAAITDRAAILLADGIPGKTPGSPPVTRGIGRDKLAALLFASVIQTLTPWSGFSDYMLAMRSTCHEWLAWGAPRNVSGTLTVDDCDQIGNAFKEVGISPSLAQGWYQTAGFFGAKGDQRVAGPAYQGGCTLGGYILKLEDLNGRQMRLVCSDPSLSPDCAGNVGNELNWQDEFGVRLTSWSRGAAQAQANVHWWRSNFENIAWTVEFVPSVPAGKTRANCEGEVTIERRSEIARHWSDWGVGGKNDDGIEPRGPMPAGCVVTGVTLEKVTSDGSPIGPPGLEVGAGNSGARLVSSDAGTSSLRAGVHWWFDAGNAIRYRVVYTIAQPVGVQCWQ